MPRPTTLDGWWFVLLRKRAGGKVGLLAALLKVTPRTICKWGSGVEPQGENLKRIQKLAGEDLLAREDCPAFLRPKKLKTKVKA